MKKRKNRLSILFFVVVTIVSVMTSSCKKDPTITPNSTLTIEEIKEVINANPEQYILPTSDITDWYALNYADSGFKSVLIDPVAVYTEAPQNWLIYKPDGGFEVFRPWTITQNENFLIEGYLVSNYDNNFQMIGDWEFGLHWINPNYFVKTSLLCNLENDTVKTEMNLTYKTSMGSVINFKHIFTGNSSEIWLPMLDFNCHYFIKYNFTFGGTVSFNPATESVVHLIYVLQYENVYNYIRIYQNQVNYGPGTDVVLELYSSNIKVEERTLSFSETEEIEPSQIIPVTSVPDKIIFTVTDWYSGIPEIIQIVEYQVVFLNMYEGTNYYVLQ